MSSFTQSPSMALPTSPRVTRQILHPIDTTYSTHGASTPSASSETLYSTSQSTPRRQRSASSLIFANATIPLSPASSISNDSTADALLEGLRPRKRSGFVRFFCCFGREERARRKVLRETGFEKAGVEGHWSEY